MRAERAERGIPEQLALARRCSPFQARRYLGWARILTTELPATLAALQAGVTTEWRAMIVARETAWLSREHRAIVDRELAPRLETLGDRRMAAKPRRSRTGSTPKAPPSGSATPRRTAGSACGRRRTP